MAQTGRKAAPLEPWQDADARPFLQIRNLTKTYGSTYAVDDLSLDIYRGEFFSLLGGSGCGKSTLLRLMAGLESPDSGQILIDGVDVTALPPYRRPVNMMFQSYALFPHMSVAQNIAFGLHQQGGLPRPRIKARVRDMLELVRLAEFGDRRPDSLSGGQRQRVALARALAREPKILLLDEPLGALDRKLREQTQFELVNLQERVGTTFITVTHDQEEAMTMSTRVAVMDAGRIVQIAAPAQLYEFPATRFVAEFIGAVNLFEGRVVDGERDDDYVDVHCEALDSTVRAFHAQPLPQGTPVVVAVRPEKLTVHHQPPPDGQNRAHGKVSEIAYLGDVSIYHLKVANGSPIRVQVTHAERYSQPHYSWDDELYLGWSPDATAVLTQ